MQLIEIDWHVSSQDIADELGINHQTVWNHLTKAGFTKKNSMFELTARSIINRIEIFDMLLKRNQMEPFHHLFRSLQNFLDEKKIG